MMEEKIFDLFRQAKCKGNYSAILFMTNSASALT